MPKFTSVGVTWNGGAPTTVTFRSTSAGVAIPAPRNPTVALRTVGCGLVMWMRVWIAPHTGSPFAAAGISAASSVLVKSNDFHGTACIIRAAATAVRRSGVGIAPAGNRAAAVRAVNSRIAAGGTAPTNTLVHDVHDRFRTVTCTGAGVTFWNQNVASASACMAKYPGKNRWDGFRAFGSG